MSSPIIGITAVASLVGFLLNSVILSLILQHGRRPYHLLFAGLLVACAIWDLGILLTMVRNQHEAELILYGYIAFIPGLFISALIFHFTRIYLGRPATKAILFLWCFSLLTLVGVSGQINDIYRYEWGNIFKIAPGSILQILLQVVIWIAANLAACWTLFRARKDQTSLVERRHTLYLMIGFMIMTFAAIKVLVVVGINIPVVLPLGMIVNDLFVALIGIAIIKDRLLDITIIVKVGALYSLLLAFIIFLFSFLEHILASQLGEFFGEHSKFIHLLTIAIVIIILMPIKHRLENLIEITFKDKAVKF